MSSPQILDLGGLEALGREWLELAARVDGSSYFQTPDWIVAWWETIGRRPPTRVAAWRDRSGRLDAVVLVEPAEVLTESPRGANDLYVALTRATQRLAVVHAEPLPEVLHRLAPRERKSAL